MNKQMRITDAQIAEARVAACIKTIAERRVVWDRKISKPAKGDLWAICPFHAEKTPSFHVVCLGERSFFKCMGCGEKGDALALEMKLTGASFREVVGRYVDLTGDGMKPAGAPSAELIEARAQAQREYEARCEAERIKRRADAVAIYVAAGVHVAGTLGEVYLRRARCIRAPLGGVELRFHSRAPLSPYEPAKAGRCSAIVAPIRNAEGEHIGSHLTFLRPDGSGKADLPHLKGSRMICGEHVGGFVRLGYVRDAVVIGEGIETALSASEACGLPGLAAINSANLRAVALPSKIQRVVIAYDRDAKGAGELSAEVLAQRLWSEGRAVEMLAPPGGFKDWNDASKARALPKLEACA